MAKNVKRFEEKADYNNLPQWAILSPMLDIKFIRVNRAQVEQSIGARGINLSLDRLLELADSRNALLQNLEQLRQQRKQWAKVQPAENDQKEIGRQIKHKIATVEHELRDLEERYGQMLQQVPNVLHPEVPLGATDQNQQLRSWGEPHYADYMQDHVTLGNRLALFDFERGAKVSGAKFYYLKNEAVLLETALIRLALDYIAARGYQLHITPDVALQQVAQGLGYAPRGAESNSYLIEESQLCLVATSEITLGGLYAEEILESEQLPMRLGGLSHCFRREAGAAGQMGRGLYRVHQFTKVEMFVICRPEDAEELHQEIVTIEEHIFQALQIPYRLLNMCSGDLGAQHYRKFDIEAWMPGRATGGDWGEVTSASHCSDYQARRLKIRYRGPQGTSYPYMLNGTAIATGRAMLALLENHQQPDGSIAIPKALQSYCGFSSIEPRH